MDDSYRNDLNRARLHIIRREWNAARRLLDALYEKDATNTEVRAMLLQVEKEQAHRQNQREGALEIGGASSKDQFAAFGVGALLLLFMIYACIVTAVTVNHSGWSSEVVLREGVSNAGRAFVWKMPVVSVLILIPISGLCGVGLLRWSLRGFTAS